jgi:hypothetical protein
VAVAAAAAASAFMLDTALAAPVAVSLGAASHGTALGAGIKDVASNPPLDTTPLELPGMLHRLIALKQGPAC